jgi:hypothetical protein
MCVCVRMCVYTLKCVRRLVVICICMYSSIPVDRRRVWICMCIDCKQIGMCPCIVVGCYMFSSSY